MSSGGHVGTEFAEHLQDVCRIRNVKGLYGKAVGNDEVKNSKRLPEYRWHNVSQRQQRLE